MTIQYLKATGEIIASVPECFITPLSIQIVEKDGDKVVRTIEAEEFDYCYIHPIIARRYNDPRKPEYNIHRRKVKFDSKGKPTKLVNQEGKVIQIIKKENLDSEMKAWNKRVKELRKANPGMKLKDSVN